jgi:hypothetical protein
VQDLSSWPVNIADGGAGQIRYFFTTTSSNGTQHWDSWNIPVLTSHTYINGDGMGHNITVYYAQCDGTFFFQSNIPIGVVLDRIVAHDGAIAGEVGVSVPETADGVDLSQLQTLGPPVLGSDVLYGGGPLPGIATPAALSQAPPVVGGGASSQDLPTYSPPQASTGGAAGTGGGSISGGVGGVASGAGAAGLGLGAAAAGDGVTAGAITGTVSTTDAKLGAQLIAASMAGVGPYTGTQTGAPTITDPAVPTTKAGVIFYPGATIDGQASTPAASLSAIASEVGRIEAKVAALLPGPDLAALAKQVVDALKGLTPGETYRLHPPCGTKPNGDPLDPIEIVVPDSLTSNGGIINRLDAIAELIDVQMSIRQPICKGKPTGEPVTVHFVNS